MPTHDEIKELIENCTWTWTAQNGVKGYEVKSKTNDRKIFLPSAGYRRGNSLEYADKYGAYWTKSLDNGYTYYSTCLDFNSSGVEWNYDKCCSGYTVRPVCP
jgi:hypothetical protein